MSWKGIQIILLVWSLFLLGWMVDETGGYNVAFPVAGGFIILSGFIVFLLFAVRLCGRLCRCCRLRRIRRPAPSREKKENTTNANNNNAWIGGTPRKEQAMVWSRCWRNSARTLTLTHTREHPHSSTPSPLLGSCEPGRFQRMLV